MLIERLFLDGRPYKVSCYLSPLSVFQKPRIYTGAFFFLRRRMPSRLTSGRIQ